MILNEDYKFRDDLVNDEKETVAIEITGETPYSGIVYRYTQVMLKEVVEGVEAKLIFGYDLLETKDFTEVSLRNDEKFQQHLGLILNAMILETLEVPADEVTEEMIQEDS